MVNQSDKIEEKRETEGKGDHVSHLPCSAKVFLREQSDLGAVRFGELELRSQRREVIALQTDRDLTRSTSVRQVR